MKKLFVFMALAIVIALSSSLFAETIDLQGSVTVSRSIKQLAKAYMAENPETEIKIAYVSSKGALDALKNGKTDGALFIKRKFEECNVVGINFIPLLTKKKHAKETPDYVFTYGLAVKGSASPALQKFVDFIKSDKGREVLRKAKFRDLSPVKAAGK